MYLNVNLRFHISSQIFIVSSVIYQVSINTFLLSLFYLNIQFSTLCSLFFIFFPIIFISWRLITSQYCSGFCHTLTWISHGFTCIPHPDLPSHIPLHLIPLGLPSAPAPRTCLMHPTWAKNLEIELPYDPAIPLQGIHTKETRSERDTYTVFLSEKSVLLFRMVIFYFLRMSWLLLISSPLFKI